MRQWAGISTRLLYMVVTQEKPETIFQDNARASSRELHNKMTDVARIVIIKTDNFKYTKVFFTD